jgi:hypothetical protein
MMTLVWAPAERADVGDGFEVVEILFLHAGEEVGSLCGEVEVEHARADDLAHTGDLHGGGIVAARKGEGGGDVACRALQDVERELDPARRDHGGVKVVFEDGLAVRDRVGPGHLRVDVGVLDVAILHGRVRVELRPQVENQRGGKSVETDKGVS